MKRLVAALLLALAGSAAAGGITYAFNDKGLIMHNGHVICVDWKGRLGWAHSTPLMPVGWASPSQGLVVGF